MRTFIRDHRDNPELHKLYVSYALEQLSVIQEFLETMGEFSRVSASILASSLQQAMQQEIMQDAAWFEAAALLFARVDTSEYFCDMD